MFFYNIHICSIQIYKLFLNHLAEIATAASISKLLVLLHAVAKEIEVWQVDAVEGLQ